ncbi:MAG: hypothetical protein JKY89_01415 [Immundisolibacteraceae bacterium]|nr:hypothetical protein [Immundisolibacteraceae bacterium]
MAETLEDFDGSIRWLLDNKHDARLLEEAVLGVISRIDQPGSPAGEAKQAFFAELYGRTGEYRRAYRQKILNVSLDDLQRAASTWLVPERASTAVVTNSSNLEKSGLELEVCPL